VSYPWTDFFQLGVVVPAFYAAIRERKGPVLGVVRKLAADPFFQAMEFSGAEDPAVRKELVGVARASGKSLVFSGGSYCYLGQHNLHDLDEGKRQRALRNVEKIIDEAIEYGCAILYVMGSEAPVASEKDKALENFANSMAALSDYARRKNPSSPLTIGVENFYRLRESPFLIGPTREVAQILRDLRHTHPNVGLTFDTSHILQLKEDLPSTYLAVQDVIAHLHLSNCLIKDKSSPFYGDKHPPYGMPGSEIGIPELAAFLEVLKKAGHFSATYPTGKPVLSLEVITPADQTPETALGGAKEAFRQAWDKINSKCKNQKPK
jgi:sugar phosphate isomerase/epimerase